MFRTMLTCVVAASFWTGAVSGQVSVSTTAETSLAIVPATAPIVMQVKGIENVRSRVKATVAAAAPDFAKLAEAGIDKAFGDLFEERKLDALSAKGPIYLAVLEMPDPQAGEPPAMAIIVRVTSYAAFRDTFLLADEKKELKSAGTGIDRCEIKGKEMFLVDKKDYVVLTQKKESAETLATKYAGLDGVMPKEVAGKFSEQDVSVYVNLASVTEKFGDNIKTTRDMLMGLMDQAAGAAQKNQMELAKKMYGGMFQMVLDGRAFVAGADFRPEGIAMHFQTVFKADSEFAASLKNQKPATLDQLGKMPAGLMIYAGADLSSDMMKGMMAMMQGMAAGEGDSAKAFEDAIAKLTAANGKSMYTSLSYPPSGVTFQEFGDPAKAIEATKAMYKAMGEGGGVMGGMLKGKPEITTEAAELRGIKFTQIKLEWDLDKMAELVPGAGDVLKPAYMKMMGTSMNVWVGMDGSRMLTVMGKDWAEAKDRLTSFFDGKGTVGQQAAFQLTRKQLPATSSLTYMVDAGLFANWMADYMITVFKALPAGALPINLPQNFTPVKTEATFVGVAIALQAERGSFDVFIPATAVQEVRKVVMPILAGAN